jgi:hypothetical protein
MLEGNSEFEVLLKRAQEKGAQMSASRQEATRAQAISLNYLETAQLWARLDREEKERVATMQESETSDAG